MLAIRGPLPPLARPLLGLVLAMLLAAASTAAAQEVDATLPSDPVLRELIQVVQRSVSTGDVDRAFFDALDDARYTAPLIDVGYFFRGTGLEPVLLSTLARLTGDSGDWQDFFEWAGREDIALPAEYDAFKGAFLARFIDPAFGRFFSGVQESARINLAEVIWGGVRVDGIPSLVNARQISPAEATAEGERLTRYCRLGDCSYPAADELVFGVSLDGDSRAYPLRLLNWHEMFNDVIGSAPLYDAPDGDALCSFRAPTPVVAVARAQGGAPWVLIRGESAGCPAQGWLAADALDWADARDWRTLPTPTEAGGAGLEARVKGRPVMLAYCTLCGAGVLYDATVELAGADAGGAQRLEFGSTGLLMRSNKLMYDRTTYTVWNALTGTPAFGPLARSEVRLAQLPVVVTDWADWLAEHPDTSVLSLETGFSRDYRNGGAYADYFNAPELMFPVWQQEAAGPPKEMVFALRLDDAPKAYPLATLIEEGVTNDVLAGRDLVIVTRASPERPFSEPGGAAVRAYEGGGLTFAAGADRGSLVDEGGGVWTVTEEALVAESGRRLARLPGHLAFRFGWYAFHPDTEVYAP